MGCFQVPGRMSLGLFSALTDHLDRQAVFLDTAARRWTFGEVLDLSSRIAGRLRLCERTQQHLASYKQPRRYEFVDEISRNAMGKLQKSRLRSR